MEKMKVKLVKSLIGATKSQIEILASLGLRKVGDVSEQPKNEATIGKVNKISHMVRLI